MNEPSCGVVLLCSGRFGTNDCDIEVHLRCLGFKEIPAGEWLCRDCCRASMEADASQAAPTTPLAQEPTMATLVPLTRTPLASFAQLALQAPLTPSAPPALPAPLAPLAQTTIMASEAPTTTLATAAASAHTDRPATPRAGVVAAPLNPVIDLSMDFSSGEESSSEEEEEVTARLRRTCTRRNTAYAETMCEPFCRGPEKDSTTRREATVGPTLEARLEVRLGQGPRQG